eukprot:c8568_g1_i1 orf=438-848(+)
MRESHNTTHTSLAVDEIHLQQPTSQRNHKGGIKRRADSREKRNPNGKKPTKKKATSTQNPAQKEKRKGHKTQSTQPPTSSEEPGTEQASKGGELTRTRGTSGGTNSEAKRRFGLWRSRPGYGGKQGGERDASEQKE